jgi:hypothetical protein
MECLGCNSTYDNTEDILINHVARHHQLKPLAECSICNRQFMIYRDGQYLKHARDYHNADMSIIIDHRNMLMNELRQLVQQFFFDNPANADDHDENSDREQIDDENQSVVSDD